MRAVGQQALADGSRSTWNAQLQRYSRAPIAPTKNPSEIFDKLTLGAVGPRKQRLDQERPNIRAQARQILRLKL